MKTTSLPPSRAKFARSALVRPKSNGAKAVQIKSILVPVDFSAPSLKALDYAVALAQVNRAQITLLNVLEVITVPEFANYPVLLPSEGAFAETRTALLNSAKEHGCTAETLRDAKVRKGVPYEEITTAARLMKVDLIVIATHGYTGLKHVLLGSTAERVVRHAPCPVLVVPARNR